MQKEIIHQHEKYMKRCIDLALLGKGNTAPNPLVGSVIVYENTIIGEGYHRKCGEAHAEVNAIGSVNDNRLLKKSILYVNLEPCSHFGKTPPCADLIIEKEISEVVIGCMDPSSKVAGKGIQKLKEAGCNVRVGVLEKESIELNKRFFIFHRKKRPYVILKWAETEDGFIDIIRKENSKKQPTWITSEFGRTLVHKWRTEEPAIMVGTNTVEIDNPKLTVRNWKGKHPIRIVIDQSLRLSRDLNVFDGEAPTILFISLEKKNLFKHNAKPFTVQVVSLKFDKKVLQRILGILYEKEIQSLIVEGGEQLLSNFIKEGLWDEARVFVGEKKFRKGVKAPQIDKKIESSVRLKNSRLNIYKNS